MSWFFQPQAPEKEPTRIGFRGTQIACGIIATSLEAGAVEIESSGPKQTRLSLQVIRTESGHDITRPGTPVSTQLLLDRFIMPGSHALLKAERPGETPEIIGQITFQENNNHSSQER